MSCLLFAFVGGDKRMMYACDELVSLGYEVCYHGFENYSGEATRCRCVEDAIAQGNVIVLPPGCTTELISRCSENDSKLLIAAGITERQEKETDRKVFNYFDDESLKIMNAVPTAEGALMIAIRETSDTIAFSDVTVVGFGRVGGAVAKLFSAAGAKVTVAVRSKTDEARCHAVGYKSCCISALAESVENCDILINTAPARVIDRKVLQKTGPDALIIDLASRPGGIDFEYANELERRVVWALSLPSTVAPRYSGKLIAQAILRKLETEGVL